jgi:DNA-directed RNA polymerase omega subunit
MTKKDLMSEALKKVPNRFLLIKAMSKRAIQMKKVDASVVESDPASFLEKVLQEIAEGKVTVEFKEKIEK